MPIVVDSPFVWVLLHLGICLIETLIIVAIAVALRWCLTMLRVRKRGSRAIATFLALGGYFLLMSAYAIRDIFWYPHYDWREIAWSYGALVVVALLAIFEALSATRDQHQAAMSATLPVDPSSAPAADTGMESKGS